MKLVLVGHRSRYSHRTNQETAPVPVIINPDYITCIQKDGDSTAINLLSSGLVYVDEPLDDVLTRLWYGVEAHTGVVSEASSTIRAYCTCSWTSSRVDNTPDHKVDIWNDFLAHRNERREKFVTNYKITTPEPGAVIQPK